MMMNVHTPFILLSVDMEACRGVARVGARTPAPPPPEKNCPCGGGGFFCLWGLFPQYGWLFHSILGSFTPFFGHVALPP